MIRVRNWVLHALALILIFVIAVVSFERLINRNEYMGTSGMANSTFPLVYIVNDNVSYNCLHGYDREMDVTQIRDTVTILPSSHQLQIQIQPFSYRVASVSYEVLTLDGQTSLENTNVVRLIEDKNYINATLEIQNQMLMEQEYMLKLKVSAGGRDVWFYTRLILEDGLHLSDYLNFVTGFYEKCVNRTDSDSLGTYVEPDESTENETTLASMNIHSSVNQLMWGDLNPQIYYKPTPSLVDINKTTASFVLEYRISSVGEGGLTERYNVREFYRLRYTDTRIFLLDFTRTTDEIFSADRDILEPNGLNLGITGMDVEYKFDQKKRIVAFEQENELWSFRIRENKVTRIFGFPQSENMDYRDFYDRNDIRILRVDESGDVWFIVTGYMNRGNHEGENGVTVYHYDDASTTVYELAFVRTMESYDMLKLDTETLARISDSGTICYLYLDGALHRINLETGASSVLAEGIRTGCRIGSASGRYFAWLEEGEVYGSRTLAMIDLETEQVQEIEVQEEDRIRPICYMGDDLVYGVAHERDMDLTHAGSEIFPMYCLNIVNPKGENLKTYEPKGIFVTAVTEGDNMLTLSRVIKNGKEYEEASDDRIVSTDVSDDVMYGLTTQTSSVRQSEIILRTGTVDDSSLAAGVTCRQVDIEGTWNIPVPMSEDRERLYYVYAGGTMDSRWRDPAPAIARANEKVGVVINEDKTFVWERGNRDTTASIKLEKIPDAFRAGILDIDRLEKMLGKEILDLTGCTLDMILYFISQGRPVLTMTKDGPVTIVGYDEYNVILLNPGSDETDYGGMQDSTKLFLESGNIFLSYL